MTVTIVAIIIVWISDAAYDAFISHEGPLWVILTDSYSHEPLLRTFLVASFLIFGITLSVIVEKRNKLSNICRTNSMAIESSMDGIAIYDRDDTYIYVNQAYAKLNGYDSPAEIVGKTYRLMYNDPERARMQQFCMPALKKNGTWRGELLATRKNGSTYFQEASVTMLEDGGRICIVRDISWRKRSEARLQRSERFLNTIFDSIRDPFCIFDRDYQIIRVNDAYAQMKHLHFKDLLGKKCQEVLHNGATACDTCIVEKSLHSADPCAKDKLVTLPNGDEVWFEIYTYPILDEEGKVSHIIEYTRDITDRKKSEVDRRRMIDKLEHLSRTDTLTGLMNRRALTEALLYELDRSRRFASDLSLILCDIDDFKEINDTYGHDAGDRALQALCATLSKIMRKTDVAGRYGGDEFMLVLPETSVKGAEILAGKLLEALSEMHLDFLEGEKRTLSLSIGIAGLETKDDTIDTLIKRADEAMYKSKQSGKSKVSSTLRA
jgi:diguanylate cyclase (GGDEF)-like protein/PAS domain S-box-containing protein